MLATKLSIMDDFPLPIGNSAIAHFMDRPTPPINPFKRLQSRYLVFATSVAASLAVAGLYALLGAWRLLPKSADDPISTPISTIAVLAVIGTVIVWVGRAEGLRLGYLFGARVPRFSIFYGVMLVASLLLFSLGISSIVFYLLSLSVPSYVSQFLARNVMLSGQNSLYPQLYDRLMLFLLLICSPLIEELIFRGILLQRWSMKWGLRWGIVASSVLFGMLHFNNPIGLTLFGLVMGLLYVRTRSLWVPVACHSLNNLAAVGLEKLSQVVSGGQTATVADIQSFWWISLILVGVSAPFLGWFIWRSWPQPTDKIPYLINFEGAGDDKVG
jgi:uncharacterized protein